jgi:hypothetical protein
MHFIVIAGTLNVKISSSKSKLVVDPKSYAQLYLKKHKNLVDSKIINL